jgi:hypothetical protein
MIQSLRHMCLNIVLEQLAKGEEAQRSISRIMFYAWEIERMLPGSSMNLLNSLMKTYSASAPCHFVFPCKVTKSYSHKYFYHQIDDNYPENVYIRNSLANIGINPPYVYQE